MPAFGQEARKGRVTDGTTGEPIAGASVFINNTTYMGLCDVDGNFDWSAFPPPPFEVTVTAVGYQATVLPVAGTGPLAIKLRAKAVGLAEVTVLSAENDGWRKYGKEFTDDFIGYSPFAARCTIRNKEVLQFRYSQQDNTLTVWADKPLLIQNEATGYQITYWLEDYTKNYTTRRLFFKGYTQFAALTSPKERKQETWQKNRQTAYRGSLNHFLRSLYSGTTADEGFGVRKLKRVPASEYGKYVPLWSDTIALQDSLRLKMLVQQIDTTDPVWTAEAWRVVRLWCDTGVTPIRLAPPAAGNPPEQEYLFVKPDTSRKDILVRYFDHNRLSPADSLMMARIRPLNAEGKPVRLPPRNGAVDILDPRLINAATFVSDRMAGRIRFHFPDYLMITYIGEREEQAYLDRRIGSGKTTPGAQGSVISLATGNGITIFPDGNFAPAYDLMLEEYWAYEKLDKLLPLDYRP